MTTVQQQQDQDWYDCSSEIHIPLQDQLLSFSNIRSEPPLVTPHSTQTIYKTIHYYSNNNNNTPQDTTATSTTTPSSSSPPLVLRTITVDFHQYYKVGGRYWMTFLIVPGVNECHEHSNLCPLHRGEQKNLVTVHPPLNPLTPYGWYRSRQIYKDAETGQTIGCVDMSFQYAADADAALWKQQDEHEHEHEHDNWMLRGSVQS